jgi:hypothetical protein
MLQSYEAICEQGQMKWLGDLPPVEETRVSVTSDKTPSTSRVKHEPSPRIAGGKCLAI